jgi:DNA-binding NtrC family response regulator
VVDDAPVMRRFLRDCLNHEGWDAAEASGAEEALALLQTDGRFDALITDLLTPPGPTGIALIQEAHARYPELPAVLIAGSALLPHQVAIKREGVSVLRKPVSPLELADFLAALTEQAGC